MTDPVALAADLVRCPSVTPEEGGALDLLQGLLAAGGFACTRVPRGGVDNLFARWGEKGHPRSFGFNGHTDVVPVGDRAAWTVDPFGGALAGGKLWGRGAADMKSGVAAFVAAALDTVAHRPPDGAILIAITGDEEGPSVDGTRALLDWMAAEGERMSVCIVGEPTSARRVGDVVKIGRRGSLNATFKARGGQRHAAYPVDLLKLVTERAGEAVPAIADLMHRLAEAQLDEGTEYFGPTTVAVTAIETGNPVTNIVPARCEGRINIRFSSAHTGASLTEWLEAQAAEVADKHFVEIDVDVKVSGEAFITLPGPLTDLVSQVCAARSSELPALTTGGGTSDARFIKDHCPVVEVGLVGPTMHQVDEHVEIAHIEELTALYRRLLGAYFA